MLLAIADLMKISLLSFSDCAKCIVVLLIWVITVSNFRIEDLYEPCSNSVFAQVKLLSEAIVCFCQSIRKQLLIIFNLCTNHDHVNECHL